MKKLALAAALAAFTGPALAGPILSGDGDAGEFCNGGPCYVQPVHPAWMVPAAPAAWVSYMPDSYDIPTPEAWGWVQHFVLDTARTIRLHIWADDTSNNPEVNGQEVAYLNGGARNFALGTCAVGAVGCEPDEYGILEVSLPAGQHTLAVEVHQRGGGPSGILVQDVSAIPLPATIVLLAGGLVGLACLRRS